MRIYDLSPLVSPRTAVFPGDVPYSREVALSFDAGHHLGLSAIHTTVHVGTHVDAPSHYHPAGSSIDERSLWRYLGPAQVISVDVARGARIFPADLGVPVLAPRVLLRTGTFPDPDAWNGDFASLSPELVAHLAGQGVVLIGIDTPSVDPADDKELPSHQALYHHDLAVLEGIVLDGVPDGLYALVALPLRLEGADASPVRAVLLPAGAVPETRPLTEGHSRGEPSQ